VVQLLDDTEIDFVILADRAEGINGKLYMMGGGWNDLQVPDFNQPVQIDIAVGVLVPWHDAFAPHALNLFFEDGEGRRLGPELSAGLQVGAGPSAKPGEPLRTILAVRGMWLLPEPGTYHVVALVDGKHRRRATFNARAAAGFGAPTMPD
jgi:hypothetical protein